jgi:hypothetical protein
LSQRRRRWARRCDGLRRGRRLRTTRSLLRGLVTVYSAGRACHPPTLWQDTDRVRMHSHAV